MKRRQAGFTLIELMVSLVLALVVMAAVITLVVAVIRSNRQTLQSTRLNQELRATLNLVANDLRRARSVGDPLTAALGANEFRPVATPGNVCAIYAYEGAAQGPWHVLGVDSGRLRVLGAGARPNTCALDGATQLSSDQVEITAIRFDRVPAGATDDFVRQIDVTITGRLVDTNPSAAPTERTMRQTVYVRSVGAGI
ncbi:PilW family protein [Noviluteimonas dokdonensis]|uniref:PilW family protein n=1 Tax=Noviluteimonas dokdonensis TaxID=414050 RepID=UPI00137869B6|nr:prepilin-type N-terminal cleavage/methylation domain-containing protein [Lysobacter dokdonensis]